MDSTLILVAMITAVPATIAALTSTAALITSRRNGRKVDRSIEHMDGRLSELLAATVRAAMSEATAAEKAVGVTKAEGVKAASDQALADAQSQRRRKSDTPDA